MTDIDNDLVSAIALVERYIRDPQDLALLGEDEKILHSIRIMMPSEKDFTYPTLSQAFFHRRTDRVRSDSCRLYFEGATVEKDYCDPERFYTLDNIRGVFYLGRTQDTRFRGLRGVRWGWACTASGMFTLKMKIVKRSDLSHHLEEIELGLCDEASLLRQFNKNRKLSEILQPFQDQLEYWAWGLREKAGKVTDLQDHLKIVTAVLKRAEINHL